MRIITEQYVKVKQAYIKDVCQTINAPLKINKSEFSTVGKFPIIDQSANLVAGYTDIEEALINDGEYVVFGDHTRIIKFVDYPFAQGADGIKILKANNNVLPKYLFYSLCNLDIPNKGYSRHWALVSNLIINLPLPKVQEEIVRILDSFTNLIDALNEELLLRQKQFEYYREKLLTFDDNELIQYIKLCDIIDYEQPSQYIVSSSEYDNNYEIPVLTAGQTFILGFTNETTGVYKASKNNPTIIFDDFTTGFHWVDFDFKVKSSAMKMLRLKDNHNLLRYVFHSMALINYVPSEHSRQWISKYSQFVIPLPHIKVQEEIVKILDSFTNLIDTIKEEIALRQKQYEYYREKLLTFE